jgi:GNAT superfamily N-acetyltransferase
MQIRQLGLDELDSAYDVVKALRTDLGYDDFEDLVYAMCHQEYRMYGIFENGLLVTYAGVSVMVNLAWKRHLFVYDLVTRPGYRGKGYGAEMLRYLADTARILQCERIALTSGRQRTDAHRFCHANGFLSVSDALVRTL